jgi:peptidoglycan hydrolase CwlO-like protein
MSKSEEKRRVVQGDLQTIVILQGERDRLTRELEETKDNLDKANLQLAIDNQLMLDATTRLARQEALIEQLGRELNAEREARRQAQNALMGR